MNRVLNNPAARVAAPLLLGVLILVSWQLICKVLKVPVYLVPMPTDIFDTLVQDWTLLSSSLMVTLKITFLAFGLSVVLGVAAAFLFVQSRILEVSLFPYAIILQLRRRNQRIDWRNRLRKRACHIKIGGEYYFVAIAVERGMKRWIALVLRVEHHVEHHQARTCSKQTIE